MPGLQGIRPDALSGFRSDDVPGPRGWLMARSGERRRGDVAVRDDAPSILAGYWKAEEATRATCLGAYYVTGDRAYRDDDGCF